MASIAKVSSGWRARWRTPDGASRSRTFRTKALAEQHLVGVEHSKLSGGYVDPRLGRTTYREWHARWWASTVDLRPSTRARDESYARNHVLPQFGGHQLASIDRMAVREWVAELSASGLAPATVQKVFQVLAKSLRAAVDGGLLPASPCERVKLPRVERQEMRFLEPAQVAALADTIDPRYRALVLLGAYGGLRLGEMLGLRAGRVDLLRRRVDVAEVLVEVRGHVTYGPPKTSAGRRSVPVPRVVADELAPLVGEPDALVFTSPEGTPVRASHLRRRVWLPAVERAGLAPLRLHDLRHTAVAFWIAAGASPREIADRAGHTSVSVVLDRYGHLLAGAEEKVTDELDAMAARAAAGGAQVVHLGR